MSLEVTQLEPFGARIEGETAESVLTDAVSPAELHELLEANGVLVFKELCLTDAQLVTFSRRLGDVITKKTDGTGAGRDGEFPEVFTVSLDPKLNDAPYMKTTVEWHIDGTTQAIPSKASLLMAIALPAVGGHTQFVNTYRAFDLLTDDEKAELADAKVFHSVESAYVKFDPAATPEVVERLRKERSQVHPLIWTHRSGRKSLVLGHTADHIVGRDRNESARLLADVQARGCAPDQILTHHWSVGDVVIWDNRGCLHRATPYDPHSGREMHRVTLVGDETIV